MGMTKMKKVGFVVFVVFLGLTLYTLGEFRKGLSFIEVANSWNDVRIQNLNEEISSFKELLKHTNNLKTKKRLTDSILKNDQRLKKIAAGRETLPQLKSQTSTFLIKFLIYLVMTILSCGMVIANNKQNILAFFTGITNGVLIKFFQQKYEHPLVIINSDNKIMFANNLARQMVGYDLFNEQIESILDRGMNNIVEINEFAYQVKTEWISPHIRALTLLKTDLGHKLELNRLIESLVVRLSKICSVKKVFLDLELGEEIGLSYDIEVPLYHIMLQMVNYATLFFNDRRIKIITAKARYPMVMMEMSLKGVVDTDKLLQGFYNNLHFKGLDIRVFSNNGILTLTFVFTSPTNLIAASV